MEIYDGGECSESRYLFVAMQPLPARNLEDALPEVPRDKIADLIGQVASAAFFLEEKQLAHRDIKPSNIAITDDYARAILLDLGVLRPFGEPGLTDDEARLFIGTHRYGSPEFLTRTEEDTVEGWRAISFYQLGGVLHDMLMRKPLFHEFAHPIAVLVEAVKSEQPQIHPEDVSPDLVLLAQNCLLKSPQARLQLVTWDDFTRPPSPRHTVESARERVAKRSLAARAAATVPAMPEPSLTPRQTARQIAEKLDGIIRLECAGGASFPRMEIIQQVEEPTNVQVVFDSDHALSIPWPLSIRFNCRVIDESMIAVQIEASACMLRAAAEHTTPPSECDLFRGPLDSLNLPTKIQDYLYLALDAAQSCDPDTLQEYSRYWLIVDNVTEI